MAEKIPERLAWAAERLAVRSDEQLLEIGCGPGVLATLIIPGLRRGTLTAIDRSPVAVARESQRNAAAVAAGKASFRVQALADADLGGQRFDRIFAVNVNVFWLDAERELAAVRRLLKRGGAVHLFYEPPSRAMSSELLRKLEARLSASGFTIRDTTIAAFRRGAGLEVVAKPGPGSAHR